MKNEADFKSFKNKIYKQLFPLKYRKIKAKNLIILKKSAQENLSDFQALENSNFRCPKISKKFFGFQSTDAHLKQ